MEEFVGSLKIYDYLARLFAGGLAIIIAYFSGLLDLAYDLKEIPLVPFVLCAYGVGMILEELSYILKQLYEKCEKKDGKSNKKKATESDTVKVNNEKIAYSKINFEKCESILLVDNREDISDESLAHAVLADSLKIACVICVLWKVGSCYFCCNNVDAAKTVAIVVVLVILSIILHLREKHYQKRRNQRMVIYCLEKGHAEIIYKDDKDIRNKKE